MVLVAGTLTLCFTQGSGMRRGAMGEQGMMMGKEKMMAMCPMHGMMTGSMMEKSVAATGDGGIVVMAGNELIKYDKDLNLVKEVEVKMDMEGMQKKMSKMTEQYPMCKSMMRGGSMMGQGSAR
jgi:hypothetical protein